MNKTFISIALTVFTLLVLVRIFNVSYPIDLRIVNTTVSSEMAVVGDGKVDVVPDTAIIDGGITVSGARTAQEAKEKMTVVNNKIIDGVKSLGVKKEDITTTNYAINPDYNYNYGGVPVQIYKAVPPVDPDQGSTTRITGYTGSARVTVKVRNKDLVTPVIQKMGDAGANNIGTPRFIVDNPEKYREQARNKAIDNAREQAKKLAKKLGIKLGGVINIVEGSSQPYPLYDRGGVMAMNAAEKSTPPTIEEGQQTVTSTVTLYFERK